MNIALYRLLWIFSFFLVISCSQDPIPKPVGYFRIDLPPDTFKAFQVEACPFSFRHHAFSFIQQKRENCWYDIIFPHFNSMIQLTYLPVSEDNMEKLLADAHNLVFRHSVKADGIKEVLYVNDHRKVFGVLYSVHGNAATATQFYVTDSLNHFLRGVVYFNVAPNEDSLRPVNEYMHQQVQHLIESLNWEVVE
jgi:gliding motility-associated lipoprotein GldD